MKSRSPIPISALPVIAALLGLTQTILGRTALGRFLIARLREKLMTLLMEGITELFREIANSRATPSNQAAAPPTPAVTASRPSAGRRKQTRHPPPGGSPARGDPAPPPEARAETPDDPPESPQLAPPPAPPRRRPAVWRRAAPQRARSPPRSPPVEKASEAGEALARPYRSEIVMNEIARLAPRPY